MAFVSFELVPHHAPPAIRKDIGRNDSIGSRPRLVLRIMKWLSSAAFLLLIGERIASSLDSIALGVAGAGLAFVVAVALSSVTRSAAHR